MDDLIKSLPMVLRAAGSSSEVVEAAAIAAWKYATGESLRNHAVATKLQDKTLIIEVRDAIWQKQLWDMRGQLLFRVNSVLGSRVINNIELLVNPKAVIVEQSKKREPADVLDNEVPLELWSAASTIEDKQLRQKFLRAALGSLKRAPTNKTP